MFSCRIIRIFKIIYFPVNLDSLYVYKKPQLLPKVKLCTINADEVCWLQYNWLNLWRHPGLRLTSKMYIRVRYEFPEGIICSQAIANSLNFTTISGVLVL